MADFTIGLSGMAAAQQAFDVIGNNIANAATEGYHVQRLELSPNYSQVPGADTFIGGVNIDRVARMYDTLLEQEILRQNSTLSSTSQEAMTLSTIESAFNEFGSEDSGLSVAIDNFFISLQNLTSNASGSNEQNQLVSNAETMADQFGSMADFLTTMQNQIQLQLEQTIDMINTATQQIAELNAKIQAGTLLGGNVGSLSDQRDKLVSDLSEWVGIEAVPVENGIVNVNAGGLNLVTGSFATPLQFGYTQNADLGIAAGDGINYQDTLTGGKVGALLSLHNTTISGIIDDLDALASSIIDAVNQYHVMGVGSAGSFTQLNSQALQSTDLADLTSVTDGTIYIRVTDTTTGQSSRYAISIDADTDTLSDVAAAVSGITGLSASVNTSNQLLIQADSNYEFDFLPQPLPEPTLVDFDDASPPTVTVSGIYSGTENDTFEFQVAGDGAVGNGTLNLQVYSSGGELVTTLNIGSGYAPGETLDVGNGLKIALSLGNLAQSNGDLFQVEAFANTDTSGFLAAAGLNTFFTGNSARNIGVNATIVNDPRRIATSLGADAADQQNITRMAAIQNRSISTLGHLTCGQFYQRLAADLGQELSLKNTQMENSQTILLNLKNRRDDISGVDINEQAAHLLMYEQMFQAMAEYMSTLNNSISTLMDML